MKLNKAQQAELLENEILYLGKTKLFIESVEIQHMDSHGYNVKVAVAKMIVNGAFDKLVGFKFKANSDEWELEDEVELVDVAPIEVIRHYRLDGVDW